MVLTQTIGGVNPAENFAAVYNTTDGDKCEVYTSGKTKNNIRDRFNNHEFRTIVIVGKLIEGYDNNHVSNCS